MGRGVCLCFADDQLAKHAEAVILERRWHRHRFALGVVGSVVIGILAGSMMVCLKLSPPDRQGDQYTVSFGIGVLLVTTAALAAYFSACFCLGRYVSSGLPLHD